MIYPIPPRNFNGKDSLAYWENFLTKDDINLILSQPEWLNLTDGIKSKRKSITNMLARYEARAGSHMG